MNHLTEATASGQPMQESPCSFCAAVVGHAMNCPVVLERVDRFANSTQVGGKHYKKCAIEPWDYAIANDMPFMEGSIVKYVTRWRKKGGIEDLKKARHYLDKLIEVATKEDTDGVGGLP